MRPSSPRAVAWLAVALLALAACKDREAAPEPPPRAELLVYAASSLTEAFGDIERAFEAAHPSVDVVLHFAGSQVLRLQIEHGAAADVFASANPEHMAALVRDGWITGDGVFARNGLVVIVPKDADGPGAVASFDDLPRAGRVVIGSEAVPVGLYTRRMLAAAAEVRGAAFAEAVRARVVSEESNVRLVRAKVEMGEADAAIVYRTDAAASDRVRALPVPAAFDVAASYHIGVVAASKRADAARAFIDFVRSPAGRALLEARGFDAGN